MAPMNILMEPKVAVVIVNWNKKDAVLNLLRSLQHIEYNEYDIFVVENASVDGSASAIRAQFPFVHLIVNDVNLGGTGGFNTGLRTVSAKGFYKYIWLLDNDAEIESLTLKKLVSAMEEDKTIGLAGSRIMDVEDSNITIEAGAYFRWDTIEVKPLFRNEKNIDVSNTIRDVDYVAICSALVRSSALEKVGLMDERYFLFWDDMDWGLQFKKHNYRVVSVLTSIAYHPPFTEKRSALVDFYYGFRNPLLTYAKHTRLIKRLGIYLKHLRYCSKVLFFLGLNGRKDLMGLGLQGIKDFVTAGWGGGDFGNISRINTSGTLTLSPEMAKRIIILNTGNREEIYGALHEMRKVLPQASLTLLVKDDRMNMFPSGFDDIITLSRDKHNRVLYLLSVFLKILANNYDAAVIPNYPSPFSYAVKNVYHYDHSKRQFTESTANRKAIWKLVTATVCGEVLAILLFPFVFMRSIFYHKY